MDWHRFDEEIPPENIDILLAQFAVAVHKTGNPEHDYVWGYFIGDRRGDKIIYNEGGIDHLVHFDEFDFWAIITRPIDSTLYAKEFDDD